ncbi:MAG TPA: TonB-dependent receptor [Polyangiaceae bacterium]
MALHALLFFALLLFTASPAWAQDDAQGGGQRGGQGAVPRGAQGAAVREAEPAPKPTVVEPKLVHYEPPVYPPAAKEQGLEAEVKLRLTLDAEGKVTAAESIEQVGHGFDEAAEQAALKLTFTPAVVNGKAVPVKWGFVYRFTLDQAAPEADTAAEVPTTGNIGGRLLVAGSELPLAGTRVVVRAADGTETSAQTDETGNWMLEGLAPGKYQVSIAAEGFDPFLLEEQVDAGQVTELTYRISPVSDVEGAIEIEVRGERPPREVTKRTIERREINRIPGTSGDALRSLQSLPGVARPPGLAGLLIVRGSAPQDTTTSVDGSYVPIIYHFGGLSSVVPTELLDRIDFYPGNFSVRYGQVQGGIVDVALRKPDTDCYGDYGVKTDEKGCYHAMGQLDLIDGRFLIQGPVGNSKNWSFAAAGRRSWVDAWIKPVLEEAGAGVTSAPVYYDYQLILDYRPSDKETFSTRFYGSDDNLEIIINDPLAQDPGFGGNLTFGTAFQRVQSVYRSELSPSVESESMISIGRDQVDFSLGTFLFDLDFYPLSLRQEFGFKIAKGVRVNAGLDFLAAWFDVLVRAPPPPRPGEPDPGPFATQPPAETHSEDFAFRPAWYADVEWQVNDRLRVVPGARVDYAQDSSNGDFSPRLTARYLLIGEDDNVWSVPRKTTLKGGAGVFHQAPQFQETDEVFGTPELLSNRSYHYSLGVEQELTQQVDLSVEGFYKDLTRQVSRDANASGAFTYANEGTGEIMGLETLLKYKPDERFFGWLAYTLSKSVRDDGPGYPERNFEWDQTHNLVVLGSYRLGDGWEFGARFRLISGGLETPVARPPSLPAIYAAEAGSYVPLQGEDFSRRLPMFHQLDVRLDKAWQFRTWRFSAYLDIQNVYNNAAVEATGYNYDYSQSTYQRGLPILPSLGLRGEF